MSGTETTTISGVAQAAPPLSLVQRLRDAAEFIGGGFRLDKDGVSGLLQEAVDAIEEPRCDCNDGMDCECGNNGADRFEEG